MTTSVIDSINVRYVMTEDGEKSDVIIPLSVWEVLIAQNRFFHSMKNGQSRPSLLPKTTIEEVAGCLEYTGKSKSLEEMEEGIRAGIMEAWGDRS